MKMISIAIDGPSGAGKSTMARKVAAELNYLYVDTGAIYRSVSLYAYRAGVDKTDSEKIVSLLPEIHIDMQYQADGIQHMILNGEDVTDAIRQNEVSLYTSAVAAIPAVRAFLLDLQRNLAATHNVIMDGRDIGTVVLPGQCHGKNLPDCLRRSPRPAALAGAPREGRPHPSGAGAGGRPAAGLQRHPSGRGAPAPGRGRSAGGHHRV